LRNKVPLTLSVGINLRILRISTRLCVIVAMTRGMNTAHGAMILANLYMIIASGNSLDPETEAYPSLSMEHEW
jgi:hypothetical protein